MLHDVSCKEVIFDNISGYSRQSLRNLRELSSNVQLSGGKTPAQVKYLLHLIWVSKHCGIKTMNVIDRIISASR